jgi:tetratricopeptide (TPR) repeat protein
MAYGSLFSTKLINDARFDEAVEAASQEIDVAPEDPEPYFNRGRAQAGRERWDAAVEDYARALGHDASASSVDPAEIDDELFFALRQWAVMERDHKQDLPAALKILDRYLTLCPEGRHVGDLDTWRDHLRGIEHVWIRERA